MYYNFANRQLRSNLGVKLGDQIFSQVTQFKYLESIIESKMDGVSGGKLLRIFVIRNQSAT